ncbi:glutamine--fructose-6-phosphate transaminase (isomerizing) [Aquiluna borgnonia]|uniref:Glutamine--fructose-6-phosphate aminotransferase [isomerizing] n=1 Tax=Aquiluna borgnonia TaxID=2499157 RepID=A0A7D4Q457_9MICO|nr:glutamine--fructose-6-phosphate transaminase (isomerizing) [Aquiluna borgnonia]QKJ24803.1 glutamine--fructose-6-phosphate transaminase (isomerizing) [Aquiluna borgnonia]
MCGIVGYVGPGSTLDVLLGGLKRLEYRGYDSAGISVIDPEAGLQTRKRAGKLNVLVEDLSASPIKDAHIGIGHTRWATHGAPTDGNAHPHLGGAHQKLSLIHNGIIENFSELKAELLAQGTKFSSQTDSEVAAHLVAREFEETGDLTAAFRRVVNRLHGAFTLLCIHEDQPDLILAARRNSPLVIGLGDGENFLGSDVAAFVEHTKRAVSVGQDQIVELRRDSVLVTDFAGHPVEFEEFTVDWDASSASKGGWPSFMAKEIADQPQAVGDTLMGRIDSEGNVRLSEFEGLDQLADVTRIIITACGTAAYAGEVAKYAIEKWAKLPVSVELAHELRYRDPVLDSNTLVIAISQSGETMDTLMATRYAKERGSKVLSICNTQGATLARESDATIYTHAGPEVAVASTKAFTAQITAGLLVALALASLRQSLPKSELNELGLELLKLPRQVKQVLESLPRMRELGREYSQAKSVLFLGRNVGYPIAMEGALKLKELAYIHAEGFAAGELKHGPIALIESGQPVIVIVPSPKGPDSLHPKVVSNIQEIKARGAKVIAIAVEGDQEVSQYADEVFYTPDAHPFTVAVLAVIPLQTFALELASAKGLDVDQPRNLAKSVTVE